MAELIKVVVAGAAGRMGSEVCQAVSADPQTELVGRVDRASSAESGIDDPAGLGPLLEKTGGDVVVDFTEAEAVPKNVTAALKAGAHAVIGTTGLSDDDIARLKKLAEETGKNILLAPNFAIGAVIMMKMGQRIASYFDRAEIVEYHHDKKKDAPSGTSILTAEMVSAGLKQEPLEEVEKRPGARGADIEGVRVHSVRLPGLVAHQEILFGLKGQVLTIRHDSIDRSSFMPGVILAVKEIGRLKGFTYGLDKIIDI